MTGVTWHSSPLRPSLSPAVRCATDEISYINGAFINGGAYTIYDIIQCEELELLPLMELPPLLPPALFDVNMLAMTDMPIEALSVAQAHATAIRRAFSIAAAFAFTTPEPR